MRYIAGPTCNVVYAVASTIFELFKKKGQKLAAAIFNYGGKGWSDVVVLTRFDISTPESLLSAEVLGFFPEVHTCSI